MTDRTEDVSAIVRTPSDASGIAGVTLIAVVGSIAATLPLLLVGALAVQLSEDLAIGPAGLGSAVGIATVARAVATALLGRTVDRLGVTTSIRLGMGASALAGLGVVLFASSWETFVPWLVVGALSHALMMPAANRLLVGRVPAHRLGVSIGIKQSAPPIATMFAGLSVPLLAATIGWRWAFVAASVIATVMLLSVRRPDGDRAKPRLDRRSKLRTQLSHPWARFLVGTGFACEFFASNSALAFFVMTAFAAGMANQTAGLVLAAASLVAILARIGSGMWCDRSPIHPLRLSSRMFLVGAFGLVLLSTGIPVVMGIGVMLSLTGSWGFTNGLWLSLMRSFPEDPGRVTGSMAWAILVGGGLGPIAFGAILEFVGPRVAWLGAAAIAVLGAVAYEGAARRLPDRAAPRSIRSGSER